MQRKARKAQVWIETVLYTLIGLSIIGLLLAVARPKITQTQDQFIIQQTLTAMNDLDTKITDLKQATGNRRIIEFQLTRGELTIDADNDVIYWTLKGGSYQYSEAGSEAEIGNIKILTIKQADKYDTRLTLDYNNENDILISRQSGTKILQAARTPYRLQIENLGINPLNLEIQVDVSTA